MPELTEPEAFILKVFKSHFRKTNRISDELIRCYKWKHVQALIEKGYIRFTNERGYYIPQAPTK